MLKANSKIQDKIQPMKKRKPIPLSKSDAIREFKRDNPKIGPKRIAAALNEQGYEVTAQFVSPSCPTNDEKNGTAPND
ncbi:hypothetical protein N8639_00230 [bacterium]|nr:hypothetical protein [bacterium]